MEPPVIGSADRPAIWVPRPSFYNRIAVYLPYVEGNRSYLREISGRCHVTASRDEFGQHCWRCSPRVLWSLIDDLAIEFGSVTVYRDYSATEICTVSCRQAKRDLCECSCGGEYHRGGLDLNSREFIKGEVIIIPGETQRIVRTFIGTRAFAGAHRG